MRILGIESSCDETAAAVVRDGRDVLSNVIASQDELHVEYGGVVPEIASRAHVQRIEPVIRQAMDDAGATLDDLDAIAVTNRPGLIGSLLVGVAAAKALAWSLEAPLIGVDHVRAHLIAGALERDDPAFPALGLVVSGGHTSIYHLNSWLDLTRLGATIDDAIGEAYDKVAAILGLPYPGGPRLDALAKQGDDSAHAFPVSLLDRDSLDFSYSGLKTAVLYTVKGKPVRVNGATQFPRDHTDLTKSDKANIAASFQKAAIKAVLAKLRRALERTDHTNETTDGGTTVSLVLETKISGGTGVSPVKNKHGQVDTSPVYRTLLVGGGVSANSRLRRELPALAREYDLELRLPRMRYCMDNAAMIAAMGARQLRAGLIDSLSLQASPTSPTSPTPPATAPA